MSLIRKARAAERKARRAERIARIKARTDAIVIGSEYFLSSMSDRDGAMVIVLDKSHAVNLAGWPSTVLVQVTEPIGDYDRDHYAVGSLHTCNATNLYETRAAAGPAGR